MLHIVIGVLLFCGVLGEIEIHQWIDYSDSQCPDENPCEACKLQFHTVKFVPDSSVTVTVGVKIVPLLSLLVDIDVTLIQNVYYSLATWYCPPLVVNGNNDKVVILVHGATYGHLYNDYPVKGYSHVHALRLAGYQVVNIDRLGIGLSDHPRGEQLNVKLGAYAIHQLIGAIKARTYAPMVNKPVVFKLFVVGHSVGSCTLSYVVGWWPNDTDGFVMSGWTHLFEATAVAAVILPVAAEPVELDPVFDYIYREIPLGGYFTSFPGNRVNFYYEDNTDPVVIAIDEETKETVTDGEEGDIFSFGWSNPMSSIKKPILQVLGEKDSAFCPLNPTTLEYDCNLPTAVIQRECLPFPFTVFSLFKYVCSRGPYYYQKVLIPDSGHDISLHKNCQIYFDIVTAWLNAH